ncbi:lipopolysaccharide biosynthesis protein [Flammeovirga pacifica]|uniref:Polysaccharide biosynthesis protein C-terminal domain-containing protein n=1 Tax=Flammeovirga pacifica TaxID=915059 RepID=A0A1S1YV93_FLAPC|nr:lipopolysaccharide biosynthesis protein [Flammeovirga pacifica]OHX64941.1 hypothetical protein NH26_00555 [Flammeovirga pacifica]
MSINLKKKTTTAFIWDFIGRIGNQGVGFIISIFLARLLEPEEYGLMAMINVIIGMSMVFADMGLGGSLIQRKRLLPVHYNSVFWFNTSIAALLSISLFLSAPYVAHFYERPELLNITRVMSLSFTINGLATIQNTYLKKQLIFKYFVQFRMVGAIISGILGIYLAFKGYGVWALVAQTLSANTVYLLLIWSVAKWKPAFNFSLKALKQLWAFGFRMFLSGLLDIVYTRLDVIIIGKAYLPAQLGFFQRAKGLDNMIISYSSGSLLAVLFPMLSQIQNNNEKYIQVVKQIHSILLFTVFLMIGAIYLVAEDLIVIIFTEKWLPSVPLFRIMALAGFGYPLSALLVNVLSSKGNSKAFLHLEIFKKLIFTCAFPFLFIYNLESYLYAYSGCMVLALTLNYLFVIKELQVTWSFFTGSIVKTILISIPLIYIQYNYIYIGNHWLNLLVQGSLFVVTYSILNLAFKAEGSVLMWQMIKGKLNLKN